MPNLLHISASPRGDLSYSRAIAREFLDDYRATNPSHGIDTIDLWHHDLPALDDAAIAAKHAVVRTLPHTEQQARAWSSIVQEAGRLFSYDKLLFSVPMWNWSVPFVLKRFIDVVTQPGVLFEWSPSTGYVGLLKKPVAIIYSSSFAYPADGDMQGFDHQKSYFEHWLKVIGCNDISTVTIAPTAGPEAVVSAARDAARKQARHLALDF
jgi:FMN-dependent NADH-azoreductase